MNHLKVFNNMLKKKPGQSLFRRKFLSVRLNEVGVLRSSYLMVDLGLPNEVSLGMNECIYI